jgi:hypothetical protein
MFKNMNLLLLRKYDKEGTAGKLFVDGDFFCRTLERPDLDNQRDNPETKANDSSCIPEGTYPIERDRTGRFQGFKILDVPNRKNIEIHQGNCIDDILGCIIVGNRITEGKTPYKGKVYKFWLSSSVKTLNELIARLEEKCTLKITSEASQ